MAARTIDIVLIISGDTQVIWSEPGVDARTFREDGDRYFNIGSGLTNSAPITTTWDIAEETDADSAISGLGITVAANQAAAEVATYTASVTLGENDTVSMLWLKFTAADLDDGESSNVTIRLSFNEYDEA